MKLHSLLQVLSFSGSTFDMEVPLRCSQSYLLELTRLHCLRSETYKSFWSRPVFHDYWGEFHRAKVVTVYLLAQFLNYFLLTAIWVSCFISKCILCARPELENVHLEMMGKICTLSKLQSGRLLFFKDFNEVIPLKEMSLHASRRDKRLHLKVLMLLKTLPRQKRVQNFYY